MAIAVLIGCSSDKKESKEAENKTNPQREEQIIPSNIELGDYSFVEIGIKNSIHNSMKFYQVMGFKEIPNQFEDTAMIMMSDNSLKIVLNKRSIAPAILVYLNKDLNKLKGELMKEKIAFKEPGDNYIQIKSPDGVQIAVLQGDSEGMYEVSALNMMGMMETGQIGNPAALPNPKIGIFGEFSHQVNNVEDALKWWSRLGLVSSGIMEFGYKFAILMDKKSVIGVHEKQNDKWFGSAITYFATDQEVRLEKLKKELPATMVNETGELGEGSAIVTTPEGNLFFVFKL